MWSDGHSTERGAWLARAGLLPLAVFSLGAVDAPLAHLEGFRSSLSEGEYSIRVEAEQISVQGDVCWPLVFELRDTLAQHPKVTTVAFNSGGGDPSAAAAIADEILGRSLGTEARSACLGACTAVFIAGQQRTTDDTPRLGFLRAEVGGVDIAEHRLAVWLGFDTQLDRYFRSAGVPQEFLTRIHNTPVRETWYPNLEELLEAGVVTTVLP